MIWCLSFFNALNIFPPLNTSTEKAMAPHFSTLAWQILQMEEPGGLQSMGSLGVRHDWATSLSIFTFMHWRRKWQPTPVFLPGESQGRGSLVGCCHWGCTESDTTEATNTFTFTFSYFRFILGHLLAVSIIMVGFAVMLNCSAAQLFTAHGL